MSGQPVAAHQDVDIDLLQLFRAVWQRKGRVLLITCLAAGVAFAGASMIRPTYRAETTVLIEPRAPNYDAENAKSAASEPVLDELNIASQVQLFRSVDLIRQVVRDLKLYELTEFDPDLHPSALSDLMVMLHLKKNPLDLAPEDRVIRTFLEKLQVYQVEKSRVIGIEFSSRMHGSPPPFPMKWSRSIWQFRAVPSLIAMRTRPAGWSRKFPIYVRRFPTPKRKLRIIAAAPICYRPARAVHSPPSSSMIYPRNWRGCAPTGPVRRHGPKTPRRR